MTSGPSFDYPPLSIGRHQDPVVVPRPLRDLLSAWHSADNPLELFSLVSLFEKRLLCGDGSRVRWSLPPAVTGATCLGSLLHRSFSFPSTPQSVGSQSFFRHRFLSPSLAGEGRVVFFLRTNLLFLNAVVSPTSYMHFRFLQDRRRTIAAPRRQVLVR